MSRIGKQSVIIPDGVKVEIKDNHVVVSGLKGKLELDVPKQIILAQDGNRITLNIGNEASKQTKALWGTYQRLLLNLIIGVSDGFSKRLEFQGIGWRVEVKGKKLELMLGYSHPILYKIPDGMEVSVDKSIIIISGISKQQVGQVASEIRAFRKPEPYKGKGIRYEGEHIRRKAGKQAKSAS